MSVILKGINKKDILKNDKCIFETYDWNCGRVCFLGLIMECSLALPCEPNKRAEKCPIIQIPKGHGDIKDVGKIRVVFEGDAECYEYTAFHFQEAIDEAPTILEAEEMREEL